jgi:hypothetical protein
MKPELLALLSSINDRLTALSNEVRQISELRREVKQTTAATRQMISQIEDYRAELGVRVVDHERRIVALERRPYVCR